MITLLKRKILRETGKKIPQKNINRKTRESEEKQQMREEKNGNSKEKQIAKKNG